MEIESPYNPKLFGVLSYFKEDGGVQMNRGSKGLSRSLSKPGQAEQGTVLMNRNAPARSSGPGRTGTQSQSSSRRRIGLLALGNEPGAPPPHHPGRLEQVRTRGGWSRWGAGQPQCRTWACL